MIMKKFILKYKLILSFLLLLSLFTGYSFIDSDEDKQKKEMAIVLRNLLQEHYDVPEINDSYSKKVFDLYIKQIDHSKRFFTQQDSIAFASYQNKLDDEIQNGTFEFFEKTNTIYEQRLSWIANSFHTFLAQPFDFTVNESLQLDADKRPFAKDEAELKEQWRKYFKYIVLLKVQDKLELQETAIAKADTSVKIKTFEVIEKEAREKTEKEHTEMFKRLQKETKADRFAEYLNANVHVFDPHSDFFPPIEKENFDIQISGTLEGIGATLQEKDGYIKVMNIVPGSPSYKQGELKPDDLILKVAQGNEEAVDVVDMKLNNAVKLIRGKKGTTVKLTVKKPSGNIQVIPIVRDVVVLEESFAKSMIITDSLSKQKIGYILLPSFYVNFENADGRSCSKDIKEELNKLKAEKVDGIILDLRNNGGGSLSDVVKIGGYFIDQGPIVQVKGREAKPYILIDEDPSLEYNGPLVILVNQFSASASEILAAAMQDYNRAVIIGSNSTYGKGTVQRFFRLPLLDNKEDIGATKVTTQKFYRINGSSTQLKGVVPDIILPDIYSNLKIGEKEMDYAMPYDAITPTAYNAWSKKTLDVKKIQTNSQARISKNETFKHIKTDAAYIKQKQDKTDHTLNLQAYKTELLTSKKEDDMFKEGNKVITGWKFSALKADGTDSLKQEKNKEYIKTLQKDAYIYEGLQVIKNIKK
ncbi:MAG: tail-specific protease [Chitinophagaceae bacterium]|nr:tail-specific protease [Chitinophagaceae bacterium]